MGDVIPLPEPEPNVWYYSGSTKPEFAVFPLTSRYFREYAERHPDIILFYAELVMLEV